MATPKKTAKRGDNAHVQQTEHHFTFAAQSIVDMVWYNGEMIAIAVLDQRNTLGIIAKEFVTLDSRTGAFVPANIACPAVYDSNAKQVAINLYADYMKSLEKEGSNG